MFDSKVFYFFGTQRILDQIRKYLIKGLLFVLEKKF